MEKLAKTLAKTVADAYVRQFMLGDGVMGDPIITYDPITREFSWGSSLTPLGNEVHVTTLREGEFGDVGDDPVVARRAIEVYLENENVAQDILGNMS